MDVSAPPAPAVANANGPRKSAPIGALGAELVKLHQRPLTISIAVAAVVALAGPMIVLDRLPTGPLEAAQVIVWIWFAAAVCIGSFVIASLAAAVLPTVLLGSRNRKASAAHAWIGARETRRVLGSASAATKVPTTPEEAEHWLATQPDEPRLRPLRVDLLVMVGRLDEARELIDRLPQATPLDVYRAAEATALVDDQGGRPVDVAALRQLVRRFPAGEDRAEAHASLAVFEARRAIGKSDWRAPLVDARKEIPGNDIAILMRDMAMPIFRVLARRIVLPVAAFIVAIALLVTALQVL